MQGMSLFNRSQFYRALNLCEPNHCASFRKSDGLRTRCSMSVDEDLQDMTLPPLQHIATSATSHSSDLGVVRDVDIAFSFKDYFFTCPVPGTTHSLRAANPQQRFVSHLCPAGCSMVPGVSVEGPHDGVPCGVWYFPPNDLPIFDVRS